MWCVMHVGLPAHWSKPWRHQARSGKVTAWRDWIVDWILGWVDWIELFPGLSRCFRCFFLSPLTKTAGIDRGYDHLLQRDLSDAAYLSEMLERFWSTNCELLIFAIALSLVLQDLHALSMRVLVGYPEISVGRSDSLIEYALRLFALLALCGSMGVKPSCGCTPLILKRDEKIETWRTFFQFAWHDFILVRDEIAHASCCNHQVGVGAPDVLKLSASLKGYQDARQLWTDCNYSTQNWQ